MHPQTKKNILLFNLSVFGVGICNAVFNIYYVKFYLDHYKVDPKHFYWAQVLFMIWNALNDPLLAYLQDVSSIKLFRSRKLSLYYGAIWLVLTFLMPWFEWYKYLPFSEELNIGIHLCLALCAYDTMFTYIGLAQCAAFAELSQVQEVRRVTTMSQEITSLVTASFLLGVQYTTQHGQSIVGMQYTAMAIAVIGFLCQIYASKHLQLDSDLSLERDQGMDVKIQDWKTVSKQVLRSPDFLAFVFMNFFQVFHKTFSSSFFNIFSRDLIPDTAFKRNFILFSSGIMFFLPQLIVLTIYRPFLPKVGAFRVVMGSHLVKVLAPILVFFIGMEYPYIIILYMTLDSALSSATFALFNLLVSDVIDLDTRTHKRDKPISSIIFGLNALFTKPAHSLSPMLVVNILTRYGYQDTDDVKSAGVQHAEFYILCLLPVCLGLCQILIWSRYSLRSTHLKPSDSSIL